MSHAFKAVPVTDRVFWVGAIDWSVRDFHGYLTSRGTTYNAFLVLADKVTLIDTVKEPYGDELLARIASVVDPKRIEYVVSNHSELDHSGCLPRVIETIRPEKVFASQMGVKALKEHFRNLDFDLTAVADGERIDLGNMHLTCMETKLLHWPDSMVSWLEEEKMLFAQDAFGMHLATSERFADEIPEDILRYEGAKYFANIVWPFSPVVLKALDKIEKANLPIDIIAPDHGPIWRKDPLKVVAAYKAWASPHPPSKKVVIGFDSMWQSTTRLAEAIGEGAAARGCSVRTMSFRACHRSDIVTELLDAGAFVVGSPTINNNVYPTVADVLTYVKGLRPKGLVGQAFGSYGWSGESVSHVEEMLKQMGVELVGSPVKAKYVPGDEELLRCRELGEAIATRLGEKR